MRGPSRRAFLATAAAAAACRRELPFDERGLTCEGDVPDGTWVRRVPFEDELAMTRPLGVVYESGLDARLIVDLTVLAPDAMEQPPDGFYLRTGVPEDLPDPATWTIGVDGLVDDPIAIPIDALLAQVEPIGVIHFECSGNGGTAAFGLMSAG